MAYRYGIKGMVCHRCDLALAELAADTSAEVVATGRGFVEFASRLTPEREQVFAKALEAIRFSILRSETEEIAEQVEHALQALVRERPDISTAEDLLAGLSPKLDLPYERAAALFRDHTLDTPLGRFQTLRMQWAAERLQEGRMQVSEVGYALGYRHLSGFSRAFKRVMGQNPVSVARRDE